MARTTEKDLNYLIGILNNALGAPSQTWVNGKAQIGNYHLYRTQGLWSVHVVMNTSGGVHTARSATSPRELRTWLEGAVWGINARS